jgi:hypothetical protein
MTLGVNMISAILGFVLVVSSLSIWLSCVWPWYRQKVEHVFLRDQNLFASDKSYTGTVTFLRWWSLLPGFLLILPRFVIIDVVLVALIVVIWYSLFRKTKESLKQSA